MNFCSDKNQETQAPSSCSDALQNVRTSVIKCGICNNILDWYAFTILYRYLCLNSI